MSDRSQKKFEYKVYQWFFLTTVVLLGCAYLSSDLSIFFPICKEVCKLYHLQTYRDPFCVSFAISCRFITYYLVHFPAYHNSTALYITMLPDTALPFWIAVRARCRVCIRYRVSSLKLRSLEDEKLQPSRLWWWTIMPKNTRGLDNPCKSNKYWLDNILLTKPVCYDLTKERAQNNNWSQVWPLVLFHSSHSNWGLPGP